MKRIILLIAVCCVAYYNATCQDVKQQTQFFSLKDPRFSLGAGLEFGGLFRYLGNTGSSSVTDNSPKSRFLYGASIDFDVYSPKSKVGLYFPLNGYISQLRFNGSGSDFNEFSLSNFELPVYFKFRLGARDAHNHIWCAVGASYDIRTASLVSSSSSTSLDSAGSTTTTTNKYHSLFKNNFSAGALVGWELNNKRAEAYEKDSTKRTSNWRTVIFVRVNYSLQNILNNDYFTNGSPTVLSEYASGTQIRYITASVGVKVFFRFPKKVPIDPDDKIEDENINDTKDKDNSGGTSDKAKRTPWE